MNKLILMKTFNSLNINFVGNLGFTYDQNLGCMLFESTLHNRPDAVAYCQSKNSQLISIDQLEGNLHLQEFMDNSGK